MLVARDPSSPLASANIHPNLTALMKTVFEKHILSGHYHRQYPDCERVQQREEVGLLILTFAQSPEPGTNPAPNTPPPGLDSGQVVEHPPPEETPAGRLGHWQG